MKNLYTIITLVTLFLSTTLFSQEFKTSTMYQITDFKSQLDTNKNETSKQIELFLFKDGQAITKLINLDKDDLDFYLDATIKVLENPTLTNVKQVIKVEFEFLSCCSNYESLYFMVTNNDELIKLPQLDYMQCEYATDKMEYIFPNQKFGQANTILTTESFLDEHQETESVTIVSTKNWKKQNAVEEYSYNYRD